MTFKASYGGARYVWNLLGTPTASPTKCSSLLLCRTMGETTVARKRFLTNPYILFTSDKFPDVKKNNPGVRVPELGRLMGQMWQKLPEIEKEKYRSRSKEEGDKMKMALDSMTQAEKDELVKVDKEQKVKRESRLQRKLKRELRKPSAADVNPFVLFLKSRMSHRGDKPISQFIKIIAEEWKNSSVDAKQVYLKQAQDNSVVYHRKLVEWEKKMLTQGHSDLVRKAVLKKGTKTMNKEDLRKKRA